MIVDILAALAGITMVGMWLKAHGLSLAAHTISIAALDERCDGYREDVAFLHAQLKRTRGDLRDVANANEVILAAVQRIDERAAENNRAIADVAKRVPGFLVVDKSRDIPPGELN